MCKPIDKSPNATHPLSRLTRQERIALWTMRAWVIGITQKIPVEEQIQEAFQRVGAPDATGQLYAFMWILSQGACRMLDVDCVCSTNISSDERTLLDILALSQHGRSFEAMILLRSMVNSTRALATADCANDFVRTLSAAGFHLPVRALETSQYAFADQAFADTPTLMPTYH
jgi:hypothetical protein